MIEGELKNMQWWSFLEMPLEIAESIVLAAICMKRQQICNSFAKILLHYFLSTGALETPWNVCRLNCGIILIFFYNSRLKNAWWIQHMPSCLKLSPDTCDVEKRPCYISKAKSLGWLKSPKSGSGNLVLLLLSAGLHWLEWNASIVFVSLFNTISDSQQHNVWLDGRQNSRLF